MVVLCLKQKQASLYLTLSSQCSPLISPKTSENLWFFDVFRRDQKETLGRKWLTQPLTIFYPLKDSKNMVFRKEVLLF